jgi:hypothetical protein
MSTFKSSCFDECMSVLLGDATGSQKYGVMISAEAEVKASQRITRGAAVASGKTELVVNGSPTEPKLVEWQNRVA